MLLNARVKPCGRIAKTLANILAQKTRLERQRRETQRIFLCDGRVAKFSSRSARQFVDQQVRKFFSGAVTQASPYEVEDFVDNNEPEHANVRKQSGLQDNLALPDKTGCVNRNAMFQAPGQQLPSVRCQSCTGIDVDATPPQARNSA